MFLVVFSVCLAFFLVLCFPPTALAVRGKVFLCVFDGSGQYGSA